MTTAEQDAWRARFDEAVRLAELDARGGVDPRELTGDLAEMQAEYDERYTSVLCEMAAAKESN